MASLLRDGQNENWSMTPNRTDKILLLLGLLSYWGGQTWIVITGSMTKDEIAIDVIHWLMLVGAALMIPYAARLPRQGIALVAAPLWLVGIVLIIGMCIIDFVFWSLPDPEFSRLVADQLIASDPLWVPFINYPGHPFTIGLTLAELSFWNTSKIGTGLVLIGGIGSNPYGYAAVILGYLVCFWKEAAEPSLTEPLQA